MRRRDWIRLALAGAASLAAGAASLAAGAAQPPPEPAAIQLLPAPATAMRQGMWRWFGESRATLSPILHQWRNVARVARGGPGGELTAGCRRLGRALGGLDREPLPVAPDPSVSLHLEETLRALTDAADSCTQGAYFLTGWRLRQADRSWRQLCGRLLLYDLSP